MRFVSNMKVFVLYKCVFKCLHYNHLMVCPKYIYVCRTV